MYASMLFALELYKARRDDLLRQAAEYRLGTVLETLPREDYFRKAC
jgi:hypothetical protein